MQGKYPTCSSFLINISLYWAEQIPHISSVFMISNSQTRASSTFNQAPKITFTSFCTYRNQVSNWAYSLASIPRSNWIDPTDFVYKRCPYANLVPYLAASLLTTLLSVHPKYIDSIYVCSYANQLPNVVIRVPDPRPGLQLTLVTGPFNATVGLQTTDGSEYSTSTQNIVSETVNNSAKSQAHKLVKSLLVQANCVGVWTRLSLRFSVHRVCTKQHHWVCGPTFRHRFSLCYKSTWID